MENNIDKKIENMISELNQLDKPGWVEYYTEKVEKVEEPPKEILSFEEYKKIKLGDRHKVGDYVYNQYDKDWHPAMNIKTIVICGFVFAALFVATIALWANGEAEAGVFALIFSFIMGIIFYKLAKKHSECMETSYSNLKNKYRTDLEAWEKYVTAVENNEKVCKVFLDNWKFPSAYFYLWCQKNGIDLTNTEKVIEVHNAVEKAKALVPKIIIEAGKFTDDLDEVSILKKYYKEGERCCDGVILGKINLPEGSVYEDVETISKLSGVDKRIFMLEKEKAPLQKKYDDASSSFNSGKNAAMELAETMQKSLQKPSDDWAIHGGIASAIGGVGAGVVAASNAIDRQNREMAAYNAQSQALSKLYAQASLSRFSPTYDQKRAREKAIELSREIRNAKDLLVVSNIESRELFKELNVSGKNFSVIEWGGNSKCTMLEIELEVSSQGKKEREGLVYDGCIFADLMVGEEILERVTFILPTYGVSAGENDTVWLKGYSAHYVPNGAEYHFDFSPEQNLWLMEKGSVTNGRQTGLSSMTICSRDKRWEQYQYSTSGEIIGCLYKHGKCSVEEMQSKNDELAAISKQKVISIANALEGDGILNKTTEDGILIFELIK